MLMIFFSAAAISSLMVRACCSARQVGPNASHSFAGNANKQASLSLAAATREQSVFTFDGVADLSWAEALTSGDEQPVNTDNNDVANHSGTILL
ncbi:exported hypothetical protein [Xanthomonas citri pv. fuscans]|uniref:Secreted protein n=1 Tax=Xanthomonas campestris pv. phaseoli TaxID=317013 RepID=A0A7Z7NII0_XANCH|nr:exported hypothetical protein [Xanthomonas citri pv. fuscans]SOO26119.1 exported hypothetical protein [Xanthomonas phaseoli pv. phaseoli]